MEFDSEIRLETLFNLSILNGCMVFDSSDGPLNEIVADPLGTRLIHSQLLIFISQN